MKNKLRLTVLSAMTLSGAAALIYEVAASQVLLYFFNSSTYSVATVLSAFLFGLAAGSLIMSAMLARIKNRQLVFAVIEFLIGMYALLFLLNLTLMPSSMLSASGIDLVISKFLISFSYLLIPTLLLGALFPLASSLLIKDVSSAGSEIGYLYSFDTFGAIAGAACSGFVLIPIFGVSFTFLIAGVISLLAGLLMVPNLKSAIGYGVGVMLFVTVLLLFGNTSVRLINDDSELTVEKSDILFNKESAYGSVIVVPVKQELNMFIDRRVQCSPMSEDFHKDFAAIVLEEITSPVRVLHIGLGCGYVLEEILNYDVVSSVDVVEINPSVVEAAVLYYGAGSLLNDPRVTLNVTDGFAHLQSTRKLYDVAIVTVQLPEIIHSSPLYTVEFFEQISASLVSDGQFVTFSTGSWDHDRVLFHTLSEVFPSVQIKRKKFIASKIPRSYQSDAADLRKLDKLLSSKKELNRMDKPILTSGLDWID